MGPIDHNMSLGELLGNLRAIIPETALERRLRNKAEFDGLDRGGQSRFAFRVKFSKLRSESMGLNAMKLDREDLLPGYVRKLTQTLRQQCITRRIPFEDGASDRAARTC